MNKHTPSLCISWEGVFLSNTRREVFWNEPNITVYYSCVFYLGQFHVRLSQSTVRVSLFVWYWLAGPRSLLSDQSANSLLTVYLLCNSANSLLDEYNMSQHPSVQFCVLRISSKLSRNLLQKVVSIRESYILNGNVNQIKIIKQS